MMSFFWRFVPSRYLLQVHNIRWLVLARFFADLFFYSTTIVIFQEQRGLNFTEIFLNESILWAAIWIADIPTSIWADRFGYRSMIIAGCVMNLLGMVVWLFAYGFWLFALSSVLGGLAIACTSGCESALLYSSIPIEERKTRGSEAFALISMATSAGLFLGLFTGSFIGAYSPALAVAASIVPIVFSLLAALRLHKQAKPTLSLETKAHVQIRRDLACIAAYYSFTAKVGAVEHFQFAGIRSGQLDLLVQPAVLCACRYSGCVVRTIHGCRYGSEILARTAYSGAATPVRNAHAARTLLLIAGHRLCTTGIYACAYRNSAIGGKYRRVLRLAASAR